MQRRVFLFLGLLLCIPVLAQADVTVTAPAAASMVQNTTLVISILVSTDASDGVNSMDFAMDVAAGGPVISAIDIIGAGTLFDPATSPDGPDANALPDGSTDFGAAGLGTTSVFNSVGFINTNVATGNRTIPAGSTLLLKLTLDSTGVALGFYTLSFPEALFLTDTFSSGYAILSVPGEVEVTAIPEPASVVMALFAAAGLAAVVIRRRRAA